MLLVFTFLLTSAQEEVEDPVVEAVNDVPDNAFPEKIEEPHLEAVSENPPSVDAPEPVVGEINPTEPAPEQTNNEETEQIKSKWVKNKDYTLEELNEMMDPSSFAANPPGLLNDMAWKMLFTGKNSMMYKANYMFKYLAEEYGLPSAQHALAFMYMNGIGMADLKDRDQNPAIVEDKGNNNQHLSKAIVHQTFASLGSDELALQTLAYQHLTGHGMKKDCEKALVYYEKAAKMVHDREDQAVLFTLANRHQDVLSQYQIKVSDYDNPTIETAAEQDTIGIANQRLYFQEMRATNDPEELINIGQFHLNGLYGLPRNVKKAEATFLKISQSNKHWALAQAFLGKIYMDGGDGVKVDYELAKSYLEKALEKNSYVAKCYYGLLYLYGLGVPKDVETAKSYLESSSKAGWYEASVHLGKMYFQGVLNTSPANKNMQHALRHFQKAAQYGSTIGFGGFKMVSLFFISFYFTHQTLAKSHQIVYGCLFNTNHP